ncbi:hypothetical protein [Oceaniglobus indicus]|uniref:hypothetical protein n=1 Tax=Oceaniglobus indicus TaxID=2047749 RepID=UPI000C1781A3|nr:hypothetical protein [Oceaniglobus indicus]
MHRALCLAFGLALGLAPAILPAQTFRSANRLTVQATGGPDFRVLFRGGALERDYWCAAANYVISGLGLPSRTRLFRATPTPRKQGQGVGFTLDPARATAKNGLSVFGSADGTISAGHARSTFCVIEPEFW